VLDINQAPFFLTIYNKSFYMKDLRQEISKIFKETFLRENPSMSYSDVSEDSMKPKTIRFNKGLENEYMVTFSMRGFLIGNTRMSFEELENAISKEYTITLKDGTVLDAVKMQQIMKYKNLF
jgi:hypothetical protein